MTNSNPVIGGARERGQQDANNLQKITYGMHYLNTLLLHIKLSVKDNLSHFNSAYNDANSIISLINNQGAQAAYETLQDAYGNYKKEDGSDDPSIIKTFIDGVKSSLSKNGDGKYDLSASKLGLAEKFLIAYKQATSTPELNDKFKDNCEKFMPLEDAFCELDVAKFNDFFNLDLE